MLKLQRNREDCVFNVILLDFNSKDFVPYNVMPYFFEEYEELPIKKRPAKNNREEVKAWLERKAQYQFWGRCEYEVLLCDWMFPEKTNKKIDVYWQIMLNIDLITDLFIKNI